MSRSTNNNKQFDVLEISTTNVAVVVGLALVRSFLSEQTWWTELKQFWRAEEAGGKAKEI